MRNLRQHLATGMTAGLAVAGTAGLAVGGYTASQESADLPGWGTPSQLAQPVTRAPNVPSWNKHLSRQFEGFKPVDSKPKDVIPHEVVAVDQWNKPLRLGLDEAHNRGVTKTKHDDVWTVGYR